MSLYYHNLESAKSEIRRLRGEVSRLEIALNCYRNNETVDKSTFDRLSTSYTELNDKFQKLQIKLINYKLGNTNE